MQATRKVEVLPEIRLGTGLPLPVRKARMIANSSHVLHDLSRTSCISGCSESAVGEGEDYDL